MVNLFLTPLTREVYKLIKILFRKVLPDLVSIVVIYYLILLETILSSAILGAGVGLGLGMIQLLSCPANSSVCSSLFQQLCFTLAILVAWMKLLITTVFTLFYIFDCFLNGNIRQKIKTNGYHKIADFIFT
jgi:hypothetical protein